jgi:surface-anchored protein
MKHIVTFVISCGLALTSARAGDIRVLVSNTAGARDYDPAVGAGYVLRPAPHVDLNVIWNATTQTFSGGFRTDDETPVVQYGPEEAIAYLPTTGQRQRSNAAAQYDFQGATGATYRVFPSSASACNAAFTLYLGFSAYGVPDDGTFTGLGASTRGRIRWTVHSVENLTTPSTNAFYGYSISAGNVNMQLTLDPAYPNREMVMLVNGHSHLNLLFHAPGMYRVTFRVRGTLVATGQEVSSLLPVYFGIEEWQIPSAAGTYDAWRDTAFTPQQAADSLISGPAADPDGDGFTNLEEFALGGNPLEPDANLIAPRLDEVGDFWILTVRKRTNAAGLTITPLATASLQPGLIDWRADMLTLHDQQPTALESIDEFYYLLNSSLSERAYLRIRTQLTAP